MLSINKPKPRPTQYFWENLPWYIMFELEPADHSQLQTYNFFYMYSIVLDNVTKMPIRKRKTNVLHYYKLLKLNHSWAQRKLSPLSPLSPLNILLTINGPLLF